MDLSTRYAQLVDAKLRNALVLRDGVIFNNRYEGDPKAGAVKIRNSGEATVADYDRASGASLTSGSSEWITVSINKDKAVNEIIDNVDAASVPDGIIADRLDAAAYALAKTMDIDGATELCTNGTALSNTSAWVKTTIYEGIVDVQKQMDEAGVPADGRWAIVSPATRAVIQKSAEWISASNLGDEVKATGAIGQICGFTVYVSNNLTSGTEAVFGHMLYATRIKEWVAMPHVQSLDGSGTYINACAVQGRYVYAHKVTKATGIYVKKTVAP